MTYCMISNLLYEVTYFIELSFNNYLYVYFNRLSRCIVQGNSITNRNNYVYLSRVKLHLFHLSVVIFVPIKLGRPRYIFFRISIAICYIYIVISNY